jgi:hypothetical protein
MLLAIVTMAIPMSNAPVSPTRSPRSTGALAPSSSWALLFTCGAMLGFVSLVWLLRGRMFDRELYEKVGGLSWEFMKAFDAGVVRLVAALVRLAGGAGLIAAVFVMAVSATSYRRADRWAWYAMWALPFGLVLDIVILASYRALSPAVFAWDVVMLGLSLGGLVIPYRAFFPEHDQAVARPATSS